MLTSEELLLYMKLVMKFKLGLMSFAEANNNEVTLSVLKLSHQDSFDCHKLSANFLGWPNKEGKLQVKPKPILSCMYYFFPSAALTK